jgi:hypothetical protein
MTLSVMLLFEFTSRALGDEGRAECLHRIRKAEEKLDTALHKHGEHSPQADARHPELKAQRERCYNRVRACGMSTSTNGMKIVTGIATIAPKGQ